MTPGGLGCDAMRSGKLQMIHSRDVRAGNLGPGCSTPAFAQSEIAADCLTLNAS